MYYVRNIFIKAKEKYNFLLSQIQQKNVYIMVKDI